MTGGIGIARRPRNRAPKFINFFCQELHRIRVARKLSLATVAASLGVTPATVGCWERGDYRPPHLDLAEKWANVLDHEFELLKR
mgnify:FL=1